jgi:histidine triad (HIT) family protein
MSSDANCLFCKIVEKKIPSRPVFEDDRLYAFEDVTPQAPVHILIVPKKHIPDVHSLAASETELLGHMFLAAQKIAAEKNLQTNGYRLVINNGRGAGQTVFHLHLHLLSGRTFSWPPG